jgi:hypothetical protein
VSVVDEAGKETHQDRHAQEGRYIDGDLCRHDGDMLYCFACVYMLIVLGCPQR